MSRPELTSSALVLSVELTMPGSASLDGKAVQAAVAELAAKLPEVVQYTFNLQLTAVAEVPGEPDAAV